MKQYNSNFASYICDMIEFKTTLGHKPSTYAANLLNFDKFCIKNFPNETVLTKELVFAWCEDVSSNSKSFYKTHIIREFGRYLVATGKEAFIYPVGLTKRYNPELPYIFTDQELINFFKASDNIPHCYTNPLLEYTIPVIFRLLYGSGMRPQEVRLLKRCDFDFLHNTIYISDSKWCKDRRIIINDNLIELCKRYDAIAESMVPNRIYFFQSPNKTAYSHGWLTATFHKCWKLSGNDTTKASVPYDFRHNYATRKLMKWIEEGKDLDVYLPYLSTYMGHACFSHTYYYIHLLPGQLAKQDFVKIDDIIPKGTA